MKSLLLSRQHYGSISVESRILPMPIIYYVYYSVILKFFICTCQYFFVPLHPQKKKWL